MPLKRVNRPIDPVKLLTNFVEITSVLPSKKTTSTPLESINSDPFVEEKILETETATKTNTISTENILKKNLDLPQLTSEEEFERISKTLTEYQVLICLFIFNIIFRIQHEFQMNV